MWACEWCDKAFKVQSQLSKHAKATVRLDARDAAQKEANTRCGRRCVPRPRANKAAAAEARAQGGAAAGRAGV